MKITDILSEGLQHPIIVVDVQPEYCGINDGDENPICVNIIDFVNKRTGPVLMFTNAEQSGMSGDTIEDVKRYWEDTICPQEQRYSYDEETDEYTENLNCPNINWNRFRIIDKGYGYLRSWMDNNVSDAVIVKVIRAMYQHRISDSREFNDIDPKLLPKLTGPEWQPWMLDDPLMTNWTSIAELKRFSGAYIVGGGRHECLREVELLMNAFNIRYKRIDSLVYG